MYILASLNPLLRVKRELRVYIKGGTVTGKFLF